MDTRPPYPIEAVLEHSTWVRGLAERLVRDPGEADDIVQETWIAADRRRPEIESGLRPWLSGVVRKLALRRRRDRARLERRERAAARSGSAPAADEAILHDEMRALVGRSLADLDEPFRSTLILRYFAGLEPSEIAAREGVPPATVRTRLRRGLDKLREDLDRRHGGRAAWCATLLGLFDRIDDVSGPAIAAGPAAVGGGIAMQLGWKIGMAAAAVALTAWVGWEVVVEDGANLVATPPVEDAPPRIDEAPAAEPVAELAPGASSDGREELEAAAVAETPAPAEAQAPAVAVLQGRVVDVAGKPLERAELTRFRAEDEVHASDAEGRFRIEVPAGERKSFESSVTLRKPGFATRSFTTILRPDAPNDLGDVVLRRACSIAGRLEDESGRPLAGTALAGPALLASNDPDQLRRQGPGYDANARYVPKATVGADGAFRFDDVEPGALRAWGTADGRGWVSSEPLDLAEGERRAGLVLRLAPLVGSDSIVGRVFAPDGSPVAAARIDAAFQTPEYATSIAATTDSAGRFEFVVQANVPHELRVEDSQDRWTAIMASPVRAGDADLELRFEETRTIEIHARSRAGGSVDEFEVRASRVESLVPGIDFGPIERTKEDERHENGLARLRVPRVPFTLEIDAPGFATAEQGPFDPARAPARIEFELEPMPGIEGRVVADAPGIGELAGIRVELHAWMQTDGSSVWKNGYRTLYGNHSDVIAKTGADGKFRLDLRKSGRYVLIAKPPPGSEGSLPDAELGPIDLDARAGAKGLELRLTAGGAIEGQVRVSSGESAAGRIVAMNHGDAEPFTVRTDAEGGFRAENLAVGKWQVMLATEEVLRSTSSWSSTAELERPDEDRLWTCRVDSGKTTRVELDDRHARSGNLAGHLRLEGGSPEGWIATLRDTAAMRPEATAGSTAVVDRDGRFELAFQRAGEHRLVLSAPGDPGAALLLRAELELEPGENAWERSLVLGKLAGTGFVPAAGEEAQFRYASREPGIEATCRLPTGPQGDFSLPLVIAGKGAIERFQPAAGEMWSRWEEIATFTVPPHAEAFVRAP